MFAKLPAYNAGLTSEDRLINTSHIEEVMPHVNVPVDPGALSTACCEIRYYTGTTAIILLSFTEITLRLVALTGVIDETGSLT